MKILDFAWRELTLDDTMEWAHLSFQISKSNDTKGNEDLCNF